VRAEVRSADLAAPLSFLRSSVLYRYCTQDRWALPKLEHLRPVRVCGKCSRLCRKAEAVVQAIGHNDVSAVAKYVSLKSDCMLHTGVYPPLTTDICGAWFGFGSGFGIGFTLTLLLARAPLLLATLLSHTIPFPRVH
jgi:hypothetical protein